MSIFILNIFLSLSSKLVVFMAPKWSLSGSKKKKAERDLFVYLFIFSFDERKLQESCGITFLIL